MIVKSWRANWPPVISVFAYSAEIRKVIFSANAIESLNNSLEKVTMPIHDWNIALHKTTFPLTIFLLYHILLDFLPFLFGLERNIQSSLFQSRYL